MAKRRRIENELDTAQNLASWWKTGCSKVADAPPPLRKQWCVAVPVYNYMIFLYNNLPPEIYLSNLNLTRFGKWQVPASDPVRRHHQVIKWVYCKYPDVYYSRFSSIFGHSTVYHSLAHSPTSCQATGVVSDELGPLSNFNRHVLGWEVREQITSLRADQFINSVTLQPKRQLGFTAVTLTLHRSTTFRPRQDFLRHCKLVKLTFSLTTLGVELLPLQARRINY